ncbi:MAG TPA: hypothetical protein VFB80_15925 [Pirellulaceae bacterium]|nr:hypothetical protein [Pirellulaceae bacterium]
MKQFGGARKGYLLESFFPTPGDLRAVLEELQPKLLITNTRVPRDYVSTPIDEWLRAYERYADRAVSGRPVTWRLSSHLHISLSKSSERVGAWPVAGEPFKVLEPRGPLVEFAPQLLFFESGRLSLSIYNLDNAAAFGLEIQCPRDSGRHLNQRLFQALCQRLRERSRPCVFVVGRKRLRPRLYISTDWGEEINRHSYLRKCKLRVELD